MLKLLSAFTVTFCMSAFGIDRLHVSINLLLVFFKLHFFTTIPMLHNLQCVAMNDLIVIVIRYSKQSKIDYTHIHRDTDAEFVAWVQVGLTCVGLGDSYIFRLCEILSVQGHMPNTPRPTQDSPNGPLSPDWWGLLWSWALCWALGCRRASRPQEVVDEKTFPCRSEARVPGWRTVHFPLVCTASWDHSIHSAQDTPTSTFRVTPVDIKR